MVVTLLYNTPLSVSDKAISKCWDKESKTVDHMLSRMYRVGVTNHHSSTLEHISYTWDIDGISRACLQELARHRHQSLSVKSTRYTLKELKEADSMNGFLVLTGNEPVDDRIIESLWGVQDMLKLGLSNDVVKYMLPEAYKTSLISTMNMRGFMNFLGLRLSKKALPEIQQLAQAMYDTIPHEHMFMYKEVV